MRKPEVLHTSLQGLRLHTGLEHLIEIGLSSSCLLIQLLFQSQHLIKRKMRVGGQTQIHRHNLAAEKRNLPNQ